jgi:hypothetical protein
MRRGPNYARNGQKEPSQPALYKLHATDIDKGTEKIMDPVARYKPHVDSEVASLASEMGVPST